MATKSDPIHRRKKKTLRDPYKVSTVIPIWGRVFGKTEIERIEISGWQGISSSQPCV